MQRPPGSASTARADRPTNFAKAVIAGDVAAGRLLRLACERHLRDLETAKERGLRWNLARADRAIDFFPAFLVHFEGPMAGRPVMLEPWQDFAIGTPFGWEIWDEETQSWRRRFRRVFEEIAKKNGKSLTAGGIGLLLAFFDSEAGAKVYAAATKKDQARLVWGAARVMVEKSRPLKARIQVRGTSLADPRTNSSFTFLGKDSKTEDGINPSGVIVDEVHRMEDRALIDLLSQSMGARQDPMTWMITTAGTTGESIWADEHDYAVKVLEEILDDEDLFIFVCNLDEDDDPFDEANWPKANPNIGVSVRWDDMRARAKEAQEKPGALNDFLRLRLNRRTQREQRWVVPDFWKRGKEAPLPMGGRIAYGGLDLGSRLDLSAFLLWIPGEEGFVDVHARFWCPEDGIVERSRKDRVPYDAWARAGLIKATPGNVTDYDVIRADLMELVNPKVEGADWADIYEVGFDPHDATQLVSQLQGDGFRMIRTMQTTTEMDPAVTEMERFLSLGKVRHGNHPVLAWMVDNTVMVQDAAGRRKPDKVKARERIDGVPALLMALKRWMANAGSETVWTAA